MKNIYKIGIAAIIAVAAVKMFKKELKTIKKAETENKKELESLGMSLAVKKYNESIVPGDDSLIKALYMSIRFNETPDVKSRVEKDKLVDVDASFLSRKVIHVGVRTDSGTGKDYLVFMFEIPRIYEGDYKSPRAKDYIFALSDAIDYIKKEIIKITPDPRKSLEGRFVLQYKGEDGKEIFKNVKIPKEYYEYEGIKTNDWSELFGYIENIRQTCTKNFVQGNANDFYDDDRKLISVESRIRSSILYYRAEFPIQSPNNVTGINLKTAFLSLGYLLNKQIVRSNSKDNIEDADNYRHIVFHGQTESGNVDLLSYYEYDEEDNELVCDSIVY